LRNYGGDRCWYSPEFALDTCANMELDSVALHNSSVPPGDTHLRLQHQQASCNVTFGSPDVLRGTTFSLELPERVAIWPDATTVRRQPTPEEWESFRPLIMQIYIHENQPFRVVAEVLRKEHNFLPS
jgi:hypothetical protein